MNLEKKLTIRESILNQGDKNSDTSFIAICCDRDDILPHLEDSIWNTGSKAENNMIAQKLIDSDYFSNKFIDLLQSDFSDVLESIISDNEIMRVIKNE